MKHIYSIFIAVFIVSVALAQAPQSFKYQAVLRDARGGIKANTDTEIGIEILESGTTIYSETHSTKTNGSGLVNLVIGEGSTRSDFSSIDWANGEYAIKVTVDGTEMGTSDLLSVPYALHAESAKYIEGVDLNNIRQTISISNDTIFISRGGYITLPRVAFTGNYADLDDKPDLNMYTTTDTTLTEAEVDAMVANNGYLMQEVDGSATNELQAISISNDTIYLSDGGFVKLPASSTGFSGSFNDLIGIPKGLADGDDDTQLTESEVDAFVDNNGYLMQEVDGSVTNELQALSISNDTIYLSDGGFVKLPTSATGFSGNYADLTGIPTNVSSFTNDAGYLTAEGDADATNELQALSISNDTIYLTDGGFVKLPATTAGFSGDFNDLTAIPTGLADGDDDTQLTETEVDAFVNNNGYASDADLILLETELANKANGPDVYTKTEVDAAGYLTSELDADPTNELQALRISNDTIYLSDGGFVKLPAVATGFSGSYNDLTDVPANLDTDATDDFDGDFTSLTNVPTGLADGDDDTQLSESEVDNMVGNNGYAMDTDVYPKTMLYTKTDVDTKLTDKVNSADLATVATSGDYTDLANTPTVFSGSFNDLTGVPTNLDTDDTDDFDGAYSSLSGAPTNVSEFTNDAGYLTSEVDGDPTNEIELPSQTGQAGKYLKTDGTTATWETVAGASTPTLSEVTNTAMSMNSGALVLPTMTTTERDAIATPVPGMMVYNTTTGIFQGYKATVDQVFENISGATQTGGAADAYDAGQEFKPDFNGTIKKVMFKPINTESGLTLRIYEGTVASHTEVYSQSYNAVADSEVEVTLTTPFVFTAGTDYIIMTESNTYYGGSDFTYGAQVYIDINAGTWNTDAADLYIRITTDVNSWVDLH